MRYLLLCFICYLSVSLQAQSTFTHQDSLFGGNTPERSWWDVNYNHLDIEVFPVEREIHGSNTIQYTVLQPYQVLQLELQGPLEIKSITQDGEELSYEQDGFSYFVDLQKEQKTGEINQIKVTYGGKPHKAVLPPWRGGISWETDSRGNPFIASSCQLEGASIWWPQKDHPMDEADSTLISVTVPDYLMNVSNGRLRKVDTLDENRLTFHWFVSNPINNYGVSINIGKYDHFDETYDGLNGPLSCDYYVLPYNLEKAKKQFKDATRMLKAFEYWLGPYPFYEDGYKLVEAPFLGMEHQSAVAYGNAYANGYLGTDLSNSGWGLKFDYIIIHESGHEWFGNSITAGDVADSWIQEGFTTYSEGLFVEYYFGKQAGAEYIRGLRRSILNNRNIIGNYGVRDQPPGDMYYKSANILHTLRQLINDDDLWLEILRGINEEFYHQILHTSQLENYIDERVDIDLKPFFEQYLRTTAIPRFIYSLENGVLKYRYENVVENFKMPIKITAGNETYMLENASDEFHTLQLGVATDIIDVDKNFYVLVEMINPPTRTTDLNQLGLKIYPNPFNENLNIKFQEYTGEIKIIDMNGTLYYDGKIRGSQSIDVDSGSWPPGPYYINLPKYSSIKILKQ